jgi:hypothetical protein
VIDDRVIIPRDWMKEYGIDVAQALAHSAAAQGHQQNSMDTDDNHDETNVSKPVKKYVPIIEVEDLHMPTPPTALSEDLGEEYKLRLAFLQAAHQRAMDNGMPKDIATDLWDDVIIPRLDVFRAGLGADPPADITPLKTVLKPGAQPIRIPMRPGKPAAREWLKGFITTLETYK